MLHKTLLIYTVFASGHDAQKRDKVEPRLLGIIVKGLAERASKTEASGGTGIPD